MVLSTVERYDDGGGASPAEPFERCLDQVGAALAEVVDVAAWSLTEPQLVDRISRALRVRAGLDELLARLVGSALERNLARLAGATSPPAWLAHSQHLTRRRAAELVSCARALTDRVEVTRHAWAAGDVSTDQAVVIAEAINQIGPDVEESACVQAQTHLVELAPQYTHDQFRHLTHHLVEVIDPDTADTRLGALLEADDKRSLAETVFRVRRGVDGMSTYTGKVNRPGIDGGSKPTKGWTHVSTEEVSQRVA